MKKFFKWFAGIVGVIVILILIFVAFNFTYLKRVATFINGDERITEVDWYEPTVEIKQASSPLLISRAESAIAQQDSQFTEALGYAEKMNSSAFLVWQKGQLIAEKYWNGYNADSYSQTNSTHKSILALVVGIAIEEGAISSVSDPVSKYLGDWIEQPHGSITLEHLLTMSSGLNKAPAKIFLFNQQFLGMHSADIDEVAKAMPQTRAPGQKFNYIGTNPQLLVAVLEAATGQQYEDYIEEKLWSKFAGSPAKLWMDREGGIPHGACCIITKADDLLRSGLVILNKGKVNEQQIVSKKWIQSMTAPSSTNPNYGYLTWLGAPYVAQRKYSDASPFSVPHSAPYLRDDIIYFDGFGGQRVYIVPSMDLVIVRVGEMKFDFDDSILPNLIIKTLAHGGNEDS